MCKIRNQSVWILEMLLKLSGGQNTVWQIMVPGGESWQVEEGNTLRIRFSKMPLCLKILLGGEQDTSKTSWRALEVK